MDPSFGPRTGPEPTHLLFAEVAEQKADALEVEPVAGVGPAPRRIRFEALAVPTFRWYWIASWISSTGDGMENVIRNVLV